MTIFREIDARQYAAIRIAIGLLAIATILSLIGESTLYFSNEGWLPLTPRELANRRDWSILFTVTSPLGVKAFFVLTLFFALAMTVGLFTRAAVWATFICVVSVNVRNHFIMSGADGILKVTLFYLAWSGCGRSWSLDSLRSRWRRNPAARWTFAPAPSHRLTSILPLRLMQIQMCFVYFTTGMAKLHGGEWLNGDALWLVLQSGVVVRYNFDWIQPDSLAFTITRWLTWTTLIFETGFPLWMTLNRWTRWGALLVGVGLHVSLSLLMEIPIFCYLMISTYLAFLPNGLFRRIEVILRRAIRRRLGARLRRPARS